MWVMCFENNFSFRPKWVNIVPTCVCVCEFVCVRLWEFSYTYSDSDYGFSFFFLLGWNQWKCFRKKSASNMRTEFWNCRISIVGFHLWETSDSQIFFFFFHFGYFFFRASNKHGETAFFPVVSQKTSLAWELPEAFLYLNIMIIWRNPVFLLLFYCFFFYFFFLWLKTEPN